MYGSAETALLEILSVPEDVERKDVDQLTYVRKEEINNKFKEIKKK
jgi:hypothetical protein